MPLSQWRLQRDAAGILNDTLFPELLLTNCFSSKYDLVLEDEEAKPSHRHSSKKKKRHHSDEEEEEEKRRTKKSKVLYSSCFRLNSALDYYSVLEKKNCQSILKAVITAHLVGML